MKNVLIDTSALIAVIANEPEKGKLVALVDGCSLIAPKSVYWEIGNAFSAMLKRGRVTIAQVECALGVFNEIPVRYLDVDLHESLVVASQRGIYAYDAYLLASAMRHKVPLLTLDQQMARMAKDMCIDVLEV
ncbi:MAG: type II toxin-antitoxin system VapC family toxin [Verrucomicrobiota bacterium]|nr:type II toxin-antitoxin system VapC family toxin [Verrucomicrobiota bacterium]